MKVHDLRFDSLDSLNNFIEGNLRRDDIINIETNGTGYILFYWYKF